MSGAPLDTRLRQVESSGEGTNWYRNPDGPEAADRIALLEGALRGVGNEARRYAEFYPQSSDGRNTFVIFAEWADRQAAQALAETEVGGE